MGLRFGGTSVTHRSRSPRTYQAYQEWRDRSYALHFVSGVLPCSLLSSSSEMSSNQAMERTAGPKAMIRLELTARRHFQLHKCSQFFVGVYNEPLSIVAMRVSNPDRSPVGIERPRHGPTPTGFVEIGGNNFPQLLPTSRWLLSVAWLNLIVLSARGNAVDVTVLAGCSEQTLDGEPTQHLGFDAVPKTSLGLGVVAHLLVTLARYPC